MKPKTFAGALLLLFVMVGVAQAQTARIETQVGPGGPAAYGLSKLEGALEARGIRTERGSLERRGLLVGTPGENARIRDLVGSGRLALPEAGESLAVKRIKEGDIEFLAVAGRDGVGLMYALLELAEEVESLPAQDDWFVSIKEVSEQPANAMRRMRILLHHEANEKDWYHSPEYWDWYLDLLARNRFNGLNVVFSHQTSYMAPMYAWHVKVPEFPDVKGKGLTEEERLRNLESLRTIARLCKERGIELTLGIWQHLPWINSWLQTRPDQENYVEGLSGENVARYSYLAMQELLRQVPDIARIQLRPNDESGIRLDIQTAFYRDSVMKAIAEASPTVLIDLRTVGVQQSTIQAARDLDRGVRTSIKFFGEFMGLPYTPVEVVTRGYSYDAYLKRPFENPVYNEVWMLGSHRIFLWGSEEYGRRFGRMASYGGTIGFETDGHLAQKGYQDPYSPAWRIFKSKEDEYFRWEMERYWAFYRCIGRFGYNPETDREVWLRPFRTRFGEAGESVALAYEEAGKVIGLIVAGHIADINMYVWPEKSMGGIFGVYNDLRGADKAYFPSINDQVAEELAGSLTGRPGPEGLARLFEEIAGAIESSLSSEAFQTSKNDKELLSTRADFSMLAHLARYRAHRHREGYRMARFLATGDLSEVEAALSEAGRSVEEWRMLTNLGDRWYYEDMLFGPNENGHWKDTLFLVETEPKLIKAAVESLRTYGIFDYGFDFGLQPLSNRNIVFTPWKYRNLYGVEPRFTFLHIGSRYDAQHGFGWTRNADMEGVRHPVVRNFHMDGRQLEPDGNLPLGQLYADHVRSLSPFSFRIDLPPEWHRFTFIFSGRSSQSEEFGPFNILTRGRHFDTLLHGDIVVPAGQVVHAQWDYNMRSTWYPSVELTFSPGKEGAEAMLSGLVVSAMRPHLGHAPVKRIDPGQDAVLSVTITVPPEKGEDGRLSASSAGRLADATLLWRLDPGGEWTRQALVSRDGFVYTAAVPAAMLGGRWLEYAFEATDHDGCMARLPRSAEQRGFRARLSADTVPPRIEHKRLVSAVPGRPAELRARVTDPDGVAVVRAYFRPLADIRPYESMILEKRGDEYVGFIPGEIITPDYELIYFLEAVDEAGNGCFYPDWNIETPYIIVPVER